MPKINVDNRATWCRMNTRKGRKPHYTTGDKMNSEIQEMYEVAQEFATNASDCSVTQYEDALKVLEFVEEGEYDKALQVGLVY